MQDLALRLRILEAHRLPLASRRCGPLGSPRAKPKAGQGVLPSARWNGLSLETGKPLLGAGDTWRAVLASLRDVAYGNGHYVAVGEPGDILVSTDGRKPESRAVDPGGGPPKDPDRSPRRCYLPRGTVYGSGGGWCRRGLSPS